MNTTSGSLFQGGVHVCASISKHIADLMLMSSDCVNFSVFIFCPFPSPRYSQCLKLKPHQARLVQKDLKTGKLLGSNGYILILFQWDMVLWLWYGGGGVSGGGGDKEETINFKGSPSVLFRPEKVF